MDSNMANKEKIKLFDSDEDEEENHDDFKIRPQYQGPHGQQILEMNSQLSKRFKLDERFVEDTEPEYSEKADEKILSEEKKERKKNIQILETILGHEVSAKALDKSLIKKKQIRFDPDDENTLKFVKIVETTCEKPKKTKTKKKKEIVEEKVEQIVPISTERYVEVCPDLKEILNTATPFSFSQKFNCNVEQEDGSFQSEVSSNIPKEVKVQNFENKSTNAQMQSLSTEQFTPKAKYDMFFITEGDPRLKEGIEFFKRPKPLEEIRIEWQKRREQVLELFRSKRRSSQRSRSTRVQSMQIKNAIRKNNFKR